MVRELLDHHYDLAYLSHFRPPATPPDQFSVELNHSEVNIPMTRRRILSPLCLPHRSLFGITKVSFCSFPPPSVVLDDSALNEKPLAAQEIEKNCTWGSKFTIMRYKLRESWSLACHALWVVLVGRR